MRKKRRGFDDEEAAAGPCEGRLQALILAQVNQLPDVRLWRTNVVHATVTRTGRVVASLPAGWSDLTGIVKPGRALFVECKGPTGTQNEDQHAFELWVTTLGARYVLARSLDDVMTAIKEMRCA